MCLKNGLVSSVTQGAISFLAFAIICLRKIDIKELRKSSHKSTPSLLLQGYAKYNHFVDP